VFRQDGGVAGSVQREVGLLRGDAKPVRGTGGWYKVTNAAVFRGLNEHASIRQKSGRVKETETGRTMLNLSQAEGTPKQEEANVLKKGGKTARRWGEHSTLVSKKVRRGRSTTKAIG